MEHETERSSPATFCVKTLCVVAIAFALTSCGHCPPVELFDGGGSRFVDVWQVEEIRVIGSDAPPVNVGGIFALTRTSSQSNQFGVTPADNFSGINERWKGLELDYKAGSKSTKLPKLPSGRRSSKANKQNEALATTKNATRQAAYGKKIEPIQPDVLEKYFRKLKSDGIESLNGSLEINGKPNFITVFSFGIKGTATESLLIFYCETERCDHSGMISARPK